MSVEPKPKKTKPTQEFAIRLLVKQSPEPTEEQIKQHLLDNPGCKGPTSARNTLINRVEKLQYTVNGEWVDVETVVVTRSH